MRATTYLTGAQVAALLGVVAFVFVSWAAAMPLAVLAAWYFVRSLQIAAKEDKEGVA
jgi:hypothetical protein